MLIIKILKNEKKINLGQGSEGETQLIKKTMKKETQIKTRTVKYRLNKEQ